jgi:8-oxo-dGTP pyrophosphatase MutT (NUDIX family)
MEWHKLKSYIKLMNQICKSAITLLPCAGLIYIEDRKLLLAFSSKKQCFYLPGGKIDPGESGEQALCREVFEEMNVRISESELEFYMHITAPAYGEKEGTIMEQDCFLLTKTISPSASAEVSVLQHFSLGEYLAQKSTAPGAIMVLQQLKTNGLID